MTKNSKESLKKFLNEWISLKPDLFSTPNLAKAVRMITKDIFEEEKERNNFLSSLVHSYSYSEPPLNQFKTLNVQHIIADQLFYSDYKEFTEQLCMLAHFLFKSIHIYEFLLIHSTKNKKIDCPHLTRMISHFNNLSNWCSTAILVSPNEKVRVRRATFMSKVGIECLNRKNYSVAIAIHSSLLSSEVYNLLKTKHLMSAKQKIEHFSEMIAKMREQNSSEYRNTLEQQFINKKPAIPDVSLHLKDLLYLKEQTGKTSDLKNPILWTLREKISEVLKRLHFFQSTSYDFNVSQLYSYLFYISGFEKEFLYRLSDNIKNERPIGFDILTIPILENLSVDFYEPHLHEKIEIEGFFL